MSQSNLSAGAFRDLLDAFGKLRVPLPGGSAAPADAAERLRRELQAAIAHHVTDARWHEIMQRMREAAEDGAKQYRLLRFPCADTTDDGRAIRQGEPNWPGTLTGEAADLYGYWERELKAGAFRIAARELEYPGGLPGDIGLFISWD